MRLNYYGDWREPDDFEEDSCWELVDRKSVPDSDGFYTDYCLYYNFCEDYYATVFGDRDLYRPEDGNFDAEFDNEAEALEWFENYNGFEDDDVYSSTKVCGSIYVVVDDCGTDVYTETFDNEDDAVSYADSEWNRLSDYDKKRRKSFYVLKSIADDIDEENSFDGDIVYQIK